MAAWWLQRLKQRLGIGCGGLVQVRKQILVRNIIIFTEICPSGIAYVFCGPSLRMGIDFETVLAWLLSASFVVLS